MAQIVTASNLVADIRVMSGLRNNQLFSDDQVVDLIVDAGNELYDIVEGTLEHYFDTTFDFTIAPGSNSVVLPSDFKRDNSMSKDPTTSYPQTVDVLGSWLERDQFNSAGWSSNGGRRYFISGSALEIFPAGNAAGNYRLYYTPFFPALAIPTSTRMYNTGGGGSYVAATRTLNVTGGGVPPGFSSNDIGGAISVIDNGGHPQMSGLYTIASIVSGTSVVLVAGPPADISSGLDAGGTIYSASGTVSAPVALPQAMAPWALYLKVHASIAIRSSRKQPTDDLQAKLQALKTRVEKSARNRTEAPKQAPLTRHVRRAYGIGWG